MSYHGRLTFFNFEKGIPVQVLFHETHHHHHPAPQLSRIHSQPRPLDLQLFSKYLSIFFSPYKRPNCCGKPLYFALKKQSPAVLFIYLDLCVYVYGAIFGTYVDGSLMTDGSQQPLGLEAFWMRTL